MASQFLVNDNPSGRLFPRQSILRTRNLRSSPFTQTSQEIKQRNWSRIHISARCRKTNTECQTTISNFYLQTFRFAFYRNYRCCFRYLYGICLVSRTQLHYFRSYWAEKAYSLILSAMLYATFASYPIVFGEMRGWTIGMTGLAFLGMLVGASIGNVIYIFEDRRYVRMLEKNNGQPLPPEARLPLTILGAICMPVALFIFAFTSYPHVHWIGSILAGIPFGLGQFCIFLCSQTYMLDTYLAHAASALAANAILRAILGSVFPLFVSFCQPFLCLADYHKQY